MAEHRQAEDRVVVSGDLGASAGCDLEARPVIVQRAPPGPAGGDVGRIDVDALDLGVRETAAEAEDLISARTAE